MRAALARGQEGNQRDAGGYTGLMRAVIKGQDRVLELLLQQLGLELNLTGGPYVQTALHMACFWGHTGSVRRLLAQPSLTCHNALDSNGCSPLMLAVERNNVGCVRELVALEGVDLETRNLEGRGLEEWARIWCSKEAWLVVKEGKRRKEEKLKKEVLEKRVEANGRLQKENIDSLVDFIEGNDKKMVIKKKIKRNASRK